MQLPKWCLRFIHSGLGGAFLLLNAMTVHAQEPVDISLIGNFWAFTASMLGAQEGGCTPGRALENTENFSGADSFDASKIREFKRSTVAITVADEETFNRVIRGFVRRPSVDLRLNGFEERGNYADSIQCTGVLVRDDIVLTAGHCVEPDFWRDRLGLELPEIRSDGTWRPISKYQFSKLLVARVNYTEKTRNNPALKKPSTIDRTEVDKFYWTFRVSGLLDSHFSAAGEFKALDFAIVRLRAYEKSITPLYALAPENISYFAPMKEENLAIFQHPGGETMKVGIGLLSRSDRRRVHYQIKTGDGSSGAGVFDARGQLVAIHVEGGCNVKTKEQRTNKGVPTALIEQQIQEALGLQKNIAGKSMFFSINHPQVAAAVGTQDVSVVSSRGFRN